MNKNENISFFQREGYLLTAIIMSIIYVSAAATTFFGTKETQS
jgi:hypothetical protein